MDNVSAAGPRADTPWHLGGRSGGSRWLDQPAGQVAVLIVVTLGFRLALAGAMGLGVDESYMIGAGRHLQLGYYDHPPVSWWLGWSAAALAGTDAPWAVRLPFILLFAVSTALLYRLTERLFGGRAGFWAACLLNAAPVLSITTGSFVLPDGPLIAALLGMAVCLQAAVRADGARGWVLWLGVGLCAGLALASKYTAVLTLAGAFVYVATAGGGHARSGAGLRAGGRFAERERGWLSRPQPYVAGLLAFSFFAPVIAWNAAHGWASFAFQGGRIGSRLHPFGPFTALFGEAIVILPWLLVPLLACAIGAARAGPADPRRWLFACLGLPPVVFFLVVSPWTHVLPHWAAPGFVMLMPLLGEAIARRDHQRWVRRGVIGTVLFTMAGGAFVASEVRLDWMPRVFERFGLGSDFDIQLVDWRSLEPALAARGLLDRPNTVFAGLRWHEVAKIDYVLGGAHKVVCLCRDPREYRFSSPAAGFVGEDAIVITSHGTLADMRAQYGGLFSSIEQLPPVVITHAGWPAMSMPVFLGHGLRDGVPRTGLAK